MSDEDCEKLVVADLVRRCTSDSIVALTGPTAVGKTSLSITAAESSGAEIVSIDSRQIYAEMSIGTAKPSREQLERVPHHFVGERSLEDPIAAGSFAFEVYRRVREIRSRDRNVLLVGGATLYLHAVLFGLDELPASDIAVRDELERTLKRSGLEALVEELRTVDPESAERLDLKNPRRVLRALEIYRITGQPASSRQGGSRRGPTLQDIPVYVANRPREELYRRIDLRVEKMFEVGLLEEVAGLLEAGFSPDLQALQTIGYRETIEHLRGKRTLEETVCLVQRNTRRYAKRQLTWFRRYPSFRWVVLEEGSTGVA